jgi:hypothetical protein
MDEKQFAISETLIKSQLKSLIAQKLWDVNVSFQVINQYDNEVQKAINVIKDDATFDKLGISH